MKRNCLSLLLSAGLTSPVSEFISLSRGDQVKKKKRKEEKNSIAAKNFNKSRQSPSLRAYGLGETVGGFVALTLGVCTGMMKAISGLCVFEGTIHLQLQTIRGEKKAKIKFKKSHAWWEDLGWKLNACAAEIAGREKKMSLRMKVVPSDGGPAFHPGLCLSSWTRGGVTVVVNIPKTLYRYRGIDLLSPLFTAYNKKDAGFFTKNRCFKAPSTGLEAALK